MGAGSLDLNANSEPTGLVIRKARLTTREKRNSLWSAFEGKIAADTSLVVFGSVAREEMTSGSDSDWIFLVDGQAQPEHADRSRDWGRRRQPTPTPQERVLLLESRPVGNREASDRVRRQILKRYLHDDRGLTRSTSARCVPRFLLNDLTRYWRTITVDLDGREKREALGRMTEAEMGSSAIWGEIRDLPRSAFGFGRFCC